MSSNNISVWESLKSHSNINDGFFSVIPIPPSILPSDPLRSINDKCNLAEVSISKIIQPIKSMFLNIFKLYLSLWIIIYTIYYFFKNR